MKQKNVAIALLALVSFVAPLVEQLLSGRVEAFSGYDLAATGVSLVLIFWWYHIDKDEHGYRAGPLMNGGVLLLAAIALPIYFVRSRGWKKGAVTTGLAALFLAATWLLGELGEWLGAAIAS